MPVPEELLPRTPKKKEPSKPDGNIEVGKIPPAPKTESAAPRKQPLIQPPLQPKPITPSTVSPETNAAVPPQAKKPFQWRTVTTRILPIFLGALLIAGISIAAVPSWRAAFNNFIAKFSPQASEVGGGCPPSAAPSITNPSQFPLYAKGGTATSNTYSASTNLGESLTFYVDNTVPHGCYTTEPYPCMGVFQTGVTAVQIGAVIGQLPAFNIDGWPFDGNNVVVPDDTWYPGLPNVKIDPNVKKLINLPDDITPIGRNVSLINDYEGANEYLVSGYSQNTVCSNGSPSKSSPATGGWCAYTNKWVGIRWGISGSAEGGQVLASCVKHDANGNPTGSGSSYRLGKDSYSVTIHPYKTTSSWKYVKYMVANSPNNSPTNLCPQGEKKEGYGYYYVCPQQNNIKVEISAVNPDYNSAKDDISWNDQQLWTNVDNYYQIPTIYKDPKTNQPIPEGKPRAKALIALMGKEIAGKILDLTFVDENGADISSKVTIEKETQVTDASGHMTIYLRSNDAVKGKIKAVYKASDGATIVNDKTNERGVEFGGGKNQMNSQVCPGENQDNLNNLEKELQSNTKNQPQSFNPKKQNWFAKITKNIKNTFVRLFNKNINKAYSQTSGSGCFSDAAELYPSNDKNFNIKITSPKKGDRIDLTIPEFLEVTSKDDIISTKPGEVDTEGVKYQIITLNADAKTEFFVTTHLSGSKESELKTLISKFPDNFSGNVTAEASRYNENDKPITKTNIDFVNKKGEADSSLSKFHINILANYPKLQINSIKRKMTVKIPQQDGTEKEEEQDATIKFPNGDGLDHEPTSSDVIVDNLYANADPKSYMYQDENDDKKWKAKIYPNDEINFTSIYAHQFVNNAELTKKLPPLKDAKIYIAMRNSEMIEKYQTTDGKGDFKEYDIKYNDVPVSKIPYRSFDLVNANAEGKTEFSVKLKDGISWDYNAMEISSLFGDWESYKALKYEADKNGNLKFDNRDLWNIINGKVTGPYGSNYLLENQDNKPAPGVMLNFTDEKDQLIIGRDTLKSDTYEKQLIQADDNGKYNVDIMRRWFKNPNLVKLQVILDNRFSQSGKETTEFPMVFYLSNDKTAYLTFEINFNDDKYKSQMSIQDVRIMSINSDPNLIFPSDVGLQREIMVHVDSWTDLFYARRFLKEKKYIDTSGKLINVKMKDLPPGMAGKYDPLISNDTLWLDKNKKIYDLFYQKYSDLVLHEFSHYLQYLLTLKNFYVPELSKYNNSIYLNHYGYINDTTFDSVTEGFAFFNATYLRNQIRRYYPSGKVTSDYTERSVNGNIQYYLCRRNFPIFEAIYFEEDLNVSGLKEDEAAAQIFCYLTIGEKNMPAKTWNAGTFFHTLRSNQEVNRHHYVMENYSNGAFTLGPFQLTQDESDSNIDKLWLMLNTRFPGSLKELFEQSKNFGLRYDTTDVNSIGLTKLEQLYLLYGVFEDNNGNWTYNPFQPGKEEIGPSGSSKSFKIGYPKNRNANGDIDQVKIFNLGIRKGRPDSYLEGSFVKFNFIDKDNKPIERGKVNMKIVYTGDKDSVNSFNDFEENMFIKSGEITYFSIPQDSLDSKAYITVEGSKDYIVMDGREYWNAMYNNGPDFDYYMSQTFKVDDSTPPIVEDMARKVEEKTNKPESLPASTPSITNENESKNDNIAGGGSIHVEASGFQQGKTADIYLNNKKINTVSLVNSGEEGFGLGINIPDNTHLGKNEIKIIDDKGHSSLIAFKVTSNKWFNIKILIFVLSFMLIVIFGYLIYNFYTKKHKLIAPH